MSQPRVFISMVRSRPLVERGRTALNSREAHFDAGPRSGTKRPIGYGLRIYPHDSFVSSKRQRGDGTYWSSHEDKVNEIRSNDLRLKLLRRKSKQVQPTRLEERRKCGHMNHNIVKCALPSSPSNGRLQRKPEVREDFNRRQISYAKKKANCIHLGDPMQKLDSSRIFDEAAARSSGKSLARNGVFYASVPIGLTPAAFKGTVENAKPVRPLAPMSGIGEKNSLQGPLTVSGLLHSLGLGKYEIAFRAEEVDMIALKQMGEKDLKDLGIPMGPRKKILLSLMPPSKRLPTQVCSLK